jgi:hypothetical protein
MASELKRVGWYRLLYYQPAPETGERITVGLLFHDEDHAFLHYDRQFLKLRKLYPWIDSKAVGFFLDDLKGALAKTTSIDALLNLYGPQLVSSDARQISLPITDAVIEMLLGKFVHPSARGPHEAKPADQVAIAIRAFVKNRMRRDLQFRTDVTSETILGRRASGVGTVALGVEHPSGWTLIDGVDLNLLTPKKAIDRADEVGRVFWHYSRLSEAGRTGSISKIGVVLNGHSHLKPKEHDAHDYALHRLEEEADTAIDSASNEATAKLERALAELAAG